MTTLTGGIEYEDFREPRGRNWGEALKDALKTTVRVAGPIALAWAKGRFLDEPAAYGGSLPPSGGQPVPTPHWTEATSPLPIPHKSFQPLTLPDNPLEIPASRYDKPTGFFAPPPQRKLFQMALPWRNPRGGSLQDLTPGLNQGELLTLPQTRQAFYTLNLERHGGKLDDWAYQALERQLHHRLSTNWMAATPKTPEGWVTMAGVAVPPQHAYGMARANFHHIAERDYPLEAEAAQALLAMRQVPVVGSPSGKSWPPKGLQPLSFPKGRVEGGRYQFPENAPDVTRNQTLYVQRIVQEVKANPTRLRYFWPGQKWDLKVQPGMPPTDNHWGVYKGQWVNNMFLANHAYGAAMAAAGRSLEDTLKTGQDFTFINTGLIHHQLLSGTFKGDQPEDQAAMISGWYEEKTKNPWPEGLHTPSFYKRLYVEKPEAYGYYQEHFKKMPDIQRLLKQSRNLHAGGR